jgi:hypothetical protein
VLIHTLFGLIECGGVGTAKGGLNECHELKIIEILSWVLAAMSIISSVPVVMRALDERKDKMERKHHNEKGSGIV